jgi:predicted MFS family arabinose efflux permease
MTGGKAGAASPSRPERAVAAGSMPNRAVPRAWLIFLVFVLAYFLSYFYRSANAVIAEDLAMDIGLGAAELGLMTSLFFLAFAAAQIPLGPALDRFGARFVTPGLMLAAALGSLLFAAADGFALLAVGRALMGLGMSGVLMGSLKAFSGWFPPRQFATVSGLFLGVGSLGALAAATPLAALNQAVGWRAVFLGGALLVLATATAIAALGRQAPWATDRDDARREKGSPWQVFASATFWRIGLLSFALTGSMFAYQGLWAGPYLVERIGLPQLATGNLLLLMGMGVSGGYMVVGWVADRLGLVRVTVAGALGMAAVQVALALFPAQWASKGLLAALFLLLGLFGSFSVLFFAHVRLAFPLHMTGRAITAVNLLGIGGSALLQWLLGGLVELHPRTIDGGYAPQAYGTIFLVTAGLIAASLIFYWPLLRDEKAASS